MTEEEKIVDMLANFLENYGAFLDDMKEAIVETYNYTWSGVTALEERAAEIVNERN